MNRLILLLCVCPLLLTGCAVAAGAGATAGVAAASEGGLKGTASDFLIQAQINDLWFRYDIETFRKLDLTVNQGRVLITGIVQDPEDRVEAVRLAWQPKGVKQVINEIRVAEEGEGLVGYARDTWITTRLRTAITLDRQVLSINYNIDTVQGTVYLMGVAQNQAELNRVIDTARTIPDVKQVVSYVKLRGDMIQDAPASYQPGQQEPQQQAAPQPQSYNNGGQYYSDGDYNQSYYGAEQPGPLYPQDTEATGAPVKLEPVQAEQIN